jgi:hypothetical protein
MQFGIPARTIGVVIMATIEWGVNEMRIADPLWSRLWQWISYCAR